MMRNEAIVEVENLYKYFPITGGVFANKLYDVKAVNGISFHINRGETLGLVGETGCGKTTTAYCILRLYKKITAGKVFFEGQDIYKLSSRKMKSMRRHMQMIFESPYASLDPRMSVEEIIGEPLRVLNIASGHEYKERVAQLLSMVGLEPDIAKRLPNEVSGGERQRIGIARALAVRPRFIVCDNPIAQLDSSIQTQLIAMLMKLQKELNVTYLFIAHDLALVRNISDRVAVMYSGRFMEMANTDELFNNPLNPYTQALLSAVPVPDPRVDRERKVIILPGELPSVINLPSGCHFHPRCSRAMDVCKELMPELEKVSGEHWVACHRV